jgi:hypothetical protein
VPLREPLTGGSGRRLDRDTTTEPDFSQQLILERAIRKPRSLLLEAFLLLRNLIL